MVQLIKPLSDIILFSFSPSSFDPLVWSTKTPDPTVGWPTLWWQAGLEKEDGSENKTDLYEAVSKVNWVEIPVCTHHEQCYCYRQLGTHALLQTSIFTIETWSCSYT